MSGHHDPVFEARSRSGPPSKLKGGSKRPEPPDLKAYYRGKRNRQALARKRAAAQRQSRQINRRIAE